MSAWKDLLADDASQSRRASPPFADADAWARCPTLDAFRERIGAEVVNFRRGEVREQTGAGYSRVVATIRINKDGQVECDSKEYALTDDEKRTIAAEIAAANFPKSCNAPKGQLPQELIGVDPKHVLISYDPTGKDIIFIQWRRNGEKPDLPFSYWSDDQWRMMEPDGLLPLYGLERLKDASEVWLHEGAKGAREVQAMVDATAAHPWGADLKLGVHLGWPGGALNADRVDWSPIKKLSPDVRVIVVCDNDQPGVDAVTTISSILRCRMSAIRFDDRFPPGFDLADGWPKRADWWKGTRYIGPTFEDCLVPATWATDIVRAGTTGAKGRPSFKVRREFAAEWKSVVDPPVFIHRKQSDMLLSTTTFNKLVRPFSDVEDTARLLQKHVSAQCNGITYAPGRDAGVINVAGQRLVNCFRTPATKAEKGDPAPFLAFMEHLVPEASDRAELLRWCATLIARPDIRMSYGVLMISQAQGVGKGTLGEAILGPLIGEWNVSVPDEQQVTESSFNSWLARKRLAIVHEIYAGHSSKAYNRLKSVITDPRVEVNEKYVPAYTLENLIHIYACSNSMRALHLDDDDRRWLVPRVTGQNKTADYWRVLHEWLRDGGLSIIKNWADVFVRDNGPVLQGQHAPSTSLKNEIISESRSEGQRVAYDLGAMVAGMQEQVVFSIEDVREWVAAQRNLNCSDSRMERPFTLRKALVAAGMKEPVRVNGKEQQRFQINGARKSHIVANFDIEAGTTWADLKKFHKTPAALLMQGI